ncbi:hypothetical protein [Algoriphagus aquimarinus]|uniref:hypothetical protein n=1 Tax=Algoriphagus aquimarinus TaxID=237018 RepID=UPI0030D8A83D|tara:strand:+ start:2873 stop:3862 length:990 start_codon:yes stop_codon:yes gene_type:complete
MKPISNKGNRLIIYLDQFSTSGIFESEVKEWKLIRELIIEGVKRGVYLCPMSSEHFIESSQKENKKAIYIDNEFYKISNGYSFKSELLITSQLISSLIRGNNITLKTFLHENIIKDILANNENFRAFDEIKKKLNVKIEEGTIVSNKLREYARHISIDKTTKNSLIDTHKSISVSRFINRLKDLINDEPTTMRGVKFPSGEIPHWIDLIIFQLLNKHKINRKEIEQLIVHLQKYGFRNIPTLDIRTSISAIISVDNKKENVNDQIDIMRASTGLPISDLFLTDKQRKSEIIELELDRKYNTKVFSGTKKDLEELIVELNRIKTAYKKNK